MSHESADPEKTAPDYVNGLLKEGSSPSHLMDYLNRQMAPVPGFTPPPLSQDAFCPIPTNCSQEDLNEYRSATVFLKSLAAELRAWGAQLPENFRPAILAVLHGGIQIQVASLAQISFDGIRIEGNMEGRPCSILAHQSTVQMLCYAIQIDRKAPPRRPIGFIWPDHNEEIE